MSLIEVSQLDVPLIVFNSNDWSNTIDDGDVAEEIIKFLKEIKNKKFSYKIEPILLVILKFLQ